MKQKTGVFAVLTAVLFLGSMAGVGCGGDDSTTAGGTAGSGGSGGGAGSGGGKAGSGGTGGTGGATGGTGGTTDAGGKGGTAGSDAGSDAPTSIMCGTSTCNPITVPLMGTYPPCCPMDAPNACGAQGPLGCLTTTPGMMDSTCPGVTVMGIPVPLPGCCRPNGNCGVDLTIGGLGCNDPVLLGGMPAGRCGGDSGMPPTDTGTPPPDTGTPPDSAPPDTGTPPDSAPPDSAPPDTGTPPDSGGGDTGGGDTGGGDTGGGDTTPPSDATAG